MPDNVEEITEDIQVREVCKENQLLWETDLIKKTGKFLKRRKIKTMKRIAFCTIVIQMDMDQMPN